MPKDEAGVDVKSLLGIYGVVNIDTYMHNCLSCWFLLHIFRSMHCENWAATAYYNQEQKTVAWKWWNQTRAYINKFN